MKAILTLLLLSHLTAIAQIQINVDQANVERSFIAVVPSQLEDSNQTQYVKYGAQIDSIILNDLDFSDYFNILPQDSFPKNADKMDVHPYPKSNNGFKWDQWNSINAEFLMLSRYTVKNEKIHLKVYLYDVTLKKDVFKKLYKVTTDSPSALAHFVCNDIIQYLANKQGIFLTKLAAVRSKKGENKKEVFIMDWDGSYLTQVSFHKSISLFPSFSLDGLKVAYSSFIYRKSIKGRRTYVLTYDIITKERKVLVSYHGTNIGSDFFPSGNEILISISSQFGGLDIFNLSLKKNKSYPILVGPKGSINVEPDLHPNGKKIVFSSDRESSKGVALYEMDVDGKNIRLLTSKGRYSTSPDWSPDGKYIVFSARVQGRFDLFLFDTEQSRVIRKLTSAKKPNGKWADNEHPSFSPDGKKILFSSNRTGNYQLFIINTDGKKLKRITKDKYDYTNPQWSPMMTKYIQL